MTDAELIANLWSWLHERGMFGPHAIVCTATKRLEELTAKPPPSALAAELERALPILKAELENLEEAKRVSQAAMRMEFGAKPTFDPVAWLRERSTLWDVGGWTRAVLLEAAAAMEAEMKEHK